jgi:autoinducer 2-degrading protein
MRIILSKVILKGHIIVPSTDLVAVNNELATHMELTKQENGCLVFEVSQDSENLNRFNVYEEFTNRESFSSHQDRVGNSKWGVVTVNVEMHYEITDVE